MAIRRASLNDITFIKECLIDSWVEHAKNHPELMTEERMRNSKVEDYYSDAIKNNKGFTFIVETEGKKTGLVRVYQDKVANFFKDPDILYIDDIYVVKKFRRKGVAKLLLKEVEKIAKQLGIKRIDARVYTFNKPTQKLLESMGFKPPHSTWTKIINS